MKLKETKPVSFRLPMEVFEALQSKGEGMNMSAHEVANKLVQENYQEPIAIDAEIVKQSAISSHSKKLVLTEVNKHVFHFTLKDLRKIFATLTNGGYLPPHISNMEIAAECNGLTRVREDLWEVLIETNTIYKSCGQG
jgi:hypothetical protein